MRGACLGALAGALSLILTAQASAHTNGSIDADPPTYEPWDDPIFGPDAEHNAAQHQAERDRNAKIVERLLTKLDFVESDGPINEQVQISGFVIFASHYARTYYNPLSDHLNPQGSASSADELVAAAAPSGREGEPVLLANENYEVIVDYATNKRYVIDHVREIIQEEPLVVGGNRANTVLADAQAKDPAAAQRLEALLGQFNKPRLDPKREFKLGPATGKTRTVELKELPVFCTWHDYEMMGGKEGEVCLTDIGSVEGLQDVRAELMNYPLAGAGKNDVLSKMRQLAEIAGPSRFPVSFTVPKAGMDEDDYLTDLVNFAKRLAREPETGVRLPVGYEQKE